jgi:uncharacterized protein
MTRAVSIGLAIVSGALFALGLVVAGMTRPEVVIGFLDVRHWDPTLVFVLAAAVPIYAIGYRLVIGRDRPLLGEQFHLPVARDITRPLVIGAALFGIGWGLVGLCPGPALTALGSGSETALVFVIAMVAGMYAERRLTNV